MAIYEGFSQTAQEVRPGFLDTVDVIPQTWLDNPCQNQGKVEKVEYTCPLFEAPGESCTKYAQVYVPYEYQQNSTKKYNIMYMIHGGGGSQEEYLYEDAPFCRMLDHAIMNREIDPIIVVSPTYYPPNDPDISVDFSGKCVKAFIPELKNYILPAVESKYRTYADLTASDPFQASRSHRGIGGFSMGGVTTWYAFLEAMDCFGWFMPMSGDCWVEGRRGGIDHPEETAHKLAKAVAEQNFTPEDFLLYFITGSEDIAWDACDAQTNAMEQNHANVFRFGINSFYALKSGGYHTVEQVRHYAYHVLKGFWKK